MKHALLLLAAFGLSFPLGCGRKATDEKVAPPVSTAPPQPSSPQQEAPLSRARPAQGLKGPRTQTLYQAAANGNVNDVKLHIQRDPETVRRPTPAGMFAIHLAAGRGHSEVIRVLLGAGADVNTPHPEVQATPLQYAAQGGHLDAVRTLLDAGAKTDPADRYGRTPLMWAALEGHGPVVQELLRRGADVNAKTKTGGWTALRYAEDKGHTAVAELLRK